MQSLTAHRFAIGQAVRLNSRFSLSPIMPETYHVTALLPAREDNLAQYRIRNDEERHERVTTEDSLEAISAPSGPGGAELQGA
ncbi:hypothetical protein [Chelativorans sp.]|uniref:hypothetical protein n=1 Tax=Chelativorans sp. TaxID=2203393 RepID=UPI0028115B45|nr:hypothetical protein [Chelativorans sp.]